MLEALANAMACTLEAATLNGRFLKQRCVGRKHLGNGTRQIDMPLRSWTPGNNRCWWLKDTVPPMMNTKPTMQPPGSQQQMTTPTASAPGASGQLLHGVMLQSTTAIAMQGFGGDASICCSDCGNYYRG